MNWYLIHTKPRQEKHAFVNLERQGFECFLPLIFVEKVNQGGISITESPLFPRYLFVRLGLDEGAKSWSPIRSTKGVNRLVSFGNEPAKISDQLIEALQSADRLMQFPQKRLFTPGDRVVVTEGAFAGVEAIYQMADGDSRVLVLIELLSKQVKFGIEPTKLRKVV